VELVRKIVGVRTVRLPGRPMVVMTDATGNRADLEAASGRTVIDITPKGVIRPVHPMLQIIPRWDIRVETEASIAVEQLRGILYDLCVLRGLPYRAFGVLTHQPLIGPLQERLDEPYAGWIKRWAYFHGSEARGSNTWIEGPAGGQGRCDCLLVFGTPRLPVHRVREHLLRIGKLGAALLPKAAAGWGPDWWSGFTESGKRVTVKTPHYADHDWHAAYHATVWAAELQAAGRPRSILERGMAGVVVTRECLCADPRSIDGRHAGIRIADGAWAPLTQAQAAVLAALRDEAGAPARRKSSAIAAAVGVTRQAVYEHLEALRAAGRVRRIGKCTGWELILPPATEP
jgi:hypothetical protein